MGLEPREHLEFSNAQCDRANLVDRDGDFTKRERERVLNQQEMVF